MHNGHHIPRTFPLCLTGGACTRKQSVTEKNIQKMSSVRKLRHDALFSCIASSRAAVANPARHEACDLGKYSEQANLVLHEKYVTVWGELRQSSVAHSICGAAQHGDDTAVMKLVMIEKNNPGRLRGAPKRRHPDIR